MTSLGFILALGCRSRAPAPDAESAEVVDLPVEVAGCASVVRDLGSRKTRCELGVRRTLRLALPDDVAAPRAAAEPPGTFAPLVREAGSGPIELEVPKGARRVVVEARRGDATARAAFDVGDAAEEPWLEAARLARTRGDTEGARTSLAGHDDDPRAVSLLARITLAEGDVEGASAAFRRAIAAHRAAGRTSDAADDAFALAFALHQRSHRYDEARRVLDEARGDLEGYAEGAAREPYYRGILAAELGDRRAASALLHEAERRASRLALLRLARNARAALALELVALGRAQEALATLRVLERDPEVRGCERAEIANDIGWVLLAGDETRASDLAAARASLEAATRTEGCTDPFVASGAFANLAQLDLDEGRAAAAASHLAAARAKVKEPRGTERLAWLDLDGRIALAGRRPAEALARFEEERAVADALLLPEAAFRAEVGRAESLDALGRGEAAADALARAERLLERVSLLVPLGGGRETFLGARDRAARLHVAVLVRRGRPRDAAEVAKRARARLLASVDRALRIERLAEAEKRTWARALAGYHEARRSLDREAAGDWSLPAADLVKVTSARRAREDATRAALERAIAELEAVSTGEAATPAPLGAGELELVVFPGSAAGAWTAFVSDATRTTTHPIGPPERETTPREILDVLVARGALRASVVHVLAYGAARMIDVSALASDATGGQPLVDLAAVDHPVGLGPREVRRDRGGVLVVGDPTKDLPRARREAELVASALGAGGAPVTTLLGGDVTAKRLLDLLPKVDTLHYAGHAVYEGADGFESALPLEGGARLAVGDLLALPNAPRTVVLSACEAARTGGAAEGLGLAPAFVVAGADVVLAPVRPVPDDVAYELARALYARDDAAAEATFVERARAALSALRRTSPSADWSAYRVITR